MSTLPGRAGQRHFAGRLTAAVLVVAFVLVPTPAHALPSLVERLIFHSVKQIEVPPQFLEMLKLHLRDPKSSHRFHPGPGEFRERNISIYALDGPFPTLTAWKKCGTSRENRLSCFRGRIREGERLGLKRLAPGDMASVYLHFNVVQSNLKTVDIRDPAEFYCPQLSERQVALGSPRVWICERLREARPLPASKISALGLPASLFDFNSR